MRITVIVVTLILVCVLFIANSQEKKNYTNMNVAQFKEYIKDTTVVVLDVRTADEFSKGHIDNAINIDFYSPSFVDDVTKTIDKNKKIALYCRSGRRSASAAEKLSPLGYNIVNLSGGYLDWSATE